MPAEKDAVEMVGELASHLWPPSAVPLFQPRVSGARLHTEHHRAIGAGGIVSDHIARRIQIRSEARNRLPQVHLGNTEYLQLKDTLGREAAAGKQEPFIVRQTACGAKNSNLVSVCALSRPRDRVPFPTDPAPTADWPDAQSRRSGSDAGDHRPDGKTAVVGAKMKRPAIDAFAHQPARADLFVAVQIDTVQAGKLTPCVKVGSVDD